MKKIGVVVNDGRAWVVCPHCQKGRWINVPENYVVKKAKCRCEEVFEILFLRRRSDRKGITVTGILKGEKNENYQIKLKDLSLQGVGFTIYSATISIGGEYDISFSFSGHVVTTTMKIVSVRGDIVGGLFIFLDEYCNAKLSVRRIWKMLASS